MSEKLRQSEINSMTPVQLIEDPRIQERFISIVNGITKSQHGEQMYVREKQWFIRTISESPDLRQCTPLSIFSAFMDVATLGLSVAQGAKPLAYLIPYYVTVGGTKQHPVKERRVNLEVSPYGELAMRKHFKQISDADNPQIVYEDDFFEEGVSGGKKYVNYKKNYDSKSRRIKAGFIRIVKTNGEVDFFTMDMAQVDRLRRYSERKNGGKANRLYTSNDGQIDEGFFLAKIIKHAFNSYPKAPFMQHVSAVFQSEKDEVDVSALREIQGDEKQQPEKTIEDAEVITDDDTTKETDSY